MMPGVRARSILAWSAAITAWIAPAPPAHAGDACDGAILRLESVSPHALDCRELHKLDETLRSCRAPVDPRDDRAGQARRGLDVALRRCVCANAPSASHLSARWAAIRTPRQLVSAEWALGQARQCAIESEHDQLAAFQAAVETARQTRQYCSGSNAEWDRSSRAPAGTCAQTRLDRTAFERWLECPDARDGDGSIRSQLVAREAEACKMAALPPPLSCEATLAIADRLRRAGQTASQRRLWNLVATELIAATSPGATSEERACATRMIATAVSDGSVSGSQMLEWLMDDPDLRGQFIRALQRALKDLTSADARRLMQLLAQTGVDVKQVLQQASQLSAQDQHRFFSVAGSLGRAIEAVRLNSAFEQSSRGLDVVISHPPARPGSCEYDDFVNVLASAFAKAVPDEAAFDHEAATHKLQERLADRRRSCGSRAPAAASGPGCGAVIAVQLFEQRASGHAIGKAQLYYVMPDGKGGSSTREIPSIQIPDFEVGCKETSQETTVAAKLLGDLQSELAKQPRETAAVVYTPVDTCGLVPLPPTGRRTARYRGQGIRFDGTDLVDLDAAVGGARNALQPWTYSVGPIDSAQARASLRLWSVPSKSGDDLQLNADLTIDGDDGPPAASFAVVLKGNPDCRASLTERQVDAGRMIGNEAGSFLASLAERTEPVVTPPRRRSWRLPLLVAIDAGLVAGGLVLVNSAVNAENDAVARGLDPAGSNQRLLVGRGLLVTAALGTAIGAIYALVR